jgi:hypothetical protein
MALDSVLLISLGFCYPRSAPFPTDPAKLETPSTYINFDLLYRNELPISPDSKCFPKSPPQNPTRSIHTASAQCCIWQIMVPFHTTIVIYSLTQRWESAIDVWSLAVDNKVDLQTLSYRTLPRRIDKVGSFTPRYIVTEQLPSFACELGGGGTMPSCWPVRKGCSRRIASWR